MVDDQNDVVRGEIAASDPKIIAPREMRLDELRHGNRELPIRHGEEVYNLRIAKNGRLLLTK